MIIYHGTNARSIDIMDSPKASRNINGLGFYATKDINVANKYGSKVIAFDIDDELIEYIERPIDQSYVEGLSTYEECAKNGMEIVMTQQQATSMAFLCNDAYVVLYVPNEYEVVPF
jgi:hypothetical protein